ncbi:MAG: Xaa-Pro peptidase family protein [Planctomycetota bacterium]
MSLMMLLLTGLLAAPPLELAPPPPVSDLNSRRQRLMEELGDGVVLVPAGDAEEKQKLSRNFYYLTGVEVPESVLMLVIREGKGEATLFLPDHDPGWERWNGKRLAPGEEATRISGIRNTVSLQRYPGALTRALKDTRVVYLEYQEVGLEEEPGPGLRRVEKIRARHPDIERFELLQNYVHRLRQVKSEYELQMLRRAVDTTGIALERAMRRARPGLYEYQVQALIESTFRAREGNGPGFGSIIGSGPNSCILHYTDNHRLLQSGELLLMDVGALAGCYTADITRTIPVSGRYTPRQREIYEIVLKAQEAAIAAVRPGATIRDVHRAARSVIQAAGHGRDFLHGTSHHVGLEVHDVRPIRELAPGMVITVEPGIYLPEEQLGVRIEDMVLVTEDGCEVLSRAIPKDPAAIERLMSKSIHSF